MAKQNLITLQLLAITGILASILVSLVAYRRFVLPVGQADLQTAAPDLTVPYLRVLVDEELTTVDQVVLTVFANTGGQQVSAADVVMNYDDTILQLVEDGVQSTGAFGVFQNIATESGQINFSAFSSIERGETLVHTNTDEEMDIAKLKFKVINPNVTITYADLVFQPGQLTESNLILYEQVRSEQPSDILNSVNRLIISLEPASNTP